MWVDRAGAKIALQETYSRNSKGSLGLVLERVRSQADLRVPILPCDPCCTAWSISVREPQRQFVNAG